MSLILDGQEMKIDLFDNSLIDVVKRTDIVLPAPCYQSQENKGCCHGCIVEIDGQRKMACSTKPADGMNIIIDRPDLKEARIKAIKEYKERIKSGGSCGCHG